MSGNSGACMYNYNIPSIFNQPFEISIETWNADIVIGA